GRWSPSPDWGGVVRFALARSKSCAAAGSHAAAVFLARRAAVTPFPGRIAIRLPALEPPGGTIRGRFWSSGSDADRGLHPSSGREGASADAIDTSAAPGPQE